VFTGTPKQVEMAKIGVNAPIVPVKTTPEGDLEAPPGPDVIGWFMGGPRPGDPGNALVTGHVDWAGPPPRPAVFWRLKELNAGEEFFVVTDKNERLPFKVEWTRIFQRNNAPVEQILGFQIGRVLTVITCEGQFISSERDYTERRVVRAKLAIG
jgi:sortase A